MCLFLMEERVRRGEYIFEVLEIRKRELEIFSVGFNEL